MRISVVDTQYAPVCYSIPSCLTHPTCVGEERFVNSEVVGVTMYIRYRFAKCQDLGPQCLKIFYEAIRAGCLDQCFGITLDVAKGIEVVEAGVSLR